MIVERAQQRDQLLARREQDEAIAHKTEPLQTEATPTLTSTDFEHIAPEVMQDFLCEKIAWLQTFANGKIKATVDEVHTVDQLHERELVEFLLFAEHKAKEHIACNV